VAVLRCTITTPEELLFEAEARSVVVPAVDGEMGFLPRHAPLVGMLGFGELRIEREGGGRKSFFVDGGFVQVLDDQVSVLATRALPVEALDAQAEEAALRRLAASPPPPGAGLEERDEHLRALAVTRTRLKLGSKERV
jgi:F-type H+-transporting ATPase subunit epsilon